MTVTNIIRLGFHIPDDVEAMRKFEAENDLSDWMRIETTESITYTHTTVHHAKVRGEEE